MRGQQQRQQRATRWQSAGCQQGLHSAGAGLLGWLWQRVTHHMGPGTAQVLHQGGHWQGQLWGRLLCNRQLHRGEGRHQEDQQRV